MNSPFDMHYKGTRARKDPEWIPCGGDMIAHVKKPNMRLKLIGGKWHSVPSNKNLTPKVQSAKVSDT